MPLYPVIIGTMPVGRTKPPRSWKRRVSGKFSKFTCTNLLHTLLINHRYLLNCRRLAVEKNLFFSIDATRFVRYWLRIRDILVTDRIENLSFWSHCAIAGTAERVRGNNHFRHAGSHCEK